MVNVSYSRALAALVLLALAACTDRLTDPGTTPDPGPTPAPLPLGIYEIQISGIDGSGDAASASKAFAVPTGPSSAMNPVMSTGFDLEFVSSGQFTDGPRNQGGQRYLSATYRVRNNTGGPVTNLTFIPVVRANTIPGTPFSQLALFNGTAASTSIAPQIVPTGAVSLGEDASMRARFTDVLQVFTEAEVAAIALPSGTTGIFPYGFMTNNPASPNSRTLPASTGPNDWGGMVTFAFRYPMQGSSTADPYNVVFQVLAVEDTETRMTESIEEGQDTAAVRRIRERAAALGATTVTVLNGSPATDPYVTDYPGQRQLCSVRTAGTSGSPTSFINRRGPYARIGIFRPGEQQDDCGAYFTAGTPDPAHYGMGYELVLKQMDRYGNVASAFRDTVTLTSTDGTAVMPGPAAMYPGTQGVDTVTATYTTYGNSTLQATGRRLQGTSSVFVNGMTRTWTGNVDTNWLTNGDWIQNFHPGVRDSVVIPSGRPNYPVLIQNTSTAGLTMTSGAGTQPFINLSSFDFTVSGNVDLGTTGTFTGTGRLVLTGSSATIGGGLSNFDVRNLRIVESGRYSLTSNVNVTGGRIVVQGGRLRNEGHRIRVRPN